MKKKQHKNLEIYKMQKKEPWSYCFCGWRERVIAVKCQDTDLPNVVMKQNQDQNWQ
jgi:hypothetical protein